MVPNTSSTTTDSLIEIAPTDGALTGLEAGFRELATTNHPLVCYLASTGDTIRYLLGHPGTQSPDAFVRQGFPPRDRHHPNHRPRTPHPHQRRRDYRVPPWGAGAAW